MLLADMCHGRPAFADARARRSAPRVNSTLLTTYLVRTAHAPSRACRQASRASQGFRSRKKHWHNGAWPSPPTAAAASREGTSARGVRDRHHGPRRGPPRSRPFAGERAMGSGNRALWGPQWTRLAKHGKYCHNGGMAFAHQHRSGWLGVQEGDHGPFRRSPERVFCRGNSPQGPGSVPFGGSDGVVCLAALGARGAHSDHSCRQSLIATASTLIMGAGSRS